MQGIKRVLVASLKPSDVRPFCIRQKRPLGAACEAADALCGRSTHVCPKPLALHLVCVLVRRCVDRPSFSNKYLSSDSYLSRIGCLSWRVYLAVVLILVVS